MRALNVLGVVWVVVVLLLIALDLISTFILITFYGDGLWAATAATAFKVSPVNIMYYLTTLAFIAPGALLIYLANRGSRTVR